MEISTIAKDPLAARRLIQLWVAIVTLIVAVAVLAFQLKTERQRIDQACNQIQTIAPNITGLQGAFGC